MGRGFALYRQIFDSQPPLWLPLISASFRVFGESFLAGQLVTATAGLITLVAVILITNRLGGKGSALLAGTLVILSPLELEWSRTINADVPSIALAAVGMVLAVEYARNRRRRWLVAASLAVTCSILLKLSGLYAVPALLLFAITRWKSTSDINQQMRFAARDVLIVGGIITGIILLSFALFSASQIWNQVVTFHWAARKVDAAVPLYEKWRVLAGLMANERLMIMTAPLAALCLLSGIDGLALFAWPCFTFLGLLYHRPLFDHHMVALVPALAAAIGVGAGYFSVGCARFLRWVSAQLHPIRIIGWAACVVVGLAILGAGVSQAWVEVAAQRALIRESPPLTSDLNMAEYVAEHTRPGETIITDAQSIAFLAARDVPPDLTDTSYTRIASGNLQARDVIDQGERYHVGLMLLWTGRLRLMPEVIQWAAKRFPHQVEFGRGRTLYMLQ